MRSKKSGKRSGVNHQLFLVHAAESGVLDGLTCPACRASSVSVWFTRPTPSEYRTWFVCGQCSFNLQTHDDRCPRYYSPDRVEERLEAYDWRLLKKAKFKSPDFWA